MSNFTDTMFNSIKTSLIKEPSKYKDILKLEVDNTYTGRFIPNLKDPTKTFFHYYSYGWKSFKNGKYITVVSPSTWDQRDLIAEERYRIRASGTDAEKEKSEKVIRKECWLTNFRVGKDPTTPENNGRTRLLRFGKQIHKIVMEAINGEDAEEYGPRIFDFSEKGCDFKIKVEKQGDFASYVGSKFSSPKAFDGLNGQTPEEIYNGILDLNKYVSCPSYDEMKSIWNEHFVLSESDSVGVEEKETAEIPAVEVASEIEDAEIKELLKDL
jgi:hypothetical protein